MKQSSLDKLFRFGCLGVVVGLIGFGILAYRVDQNFWIGFGILATMWFGISQVRVRRIRARDERVFDEVFGSMDFLKPTVEESFSYGFVHFTLTFPSEDDLRRADEAGLVKDYRSAIQEFYGHTGCKERPFDAEIAVYATYEGRVYDTVSIPSP
jgi:hypothetical protein